MLTNSNVSCYCQSPGEWRAALNCVAIDTSVFSRAPYSTKLIVYCVVAGSWFQITSTVFIINTGTYCIILVWQLFFGAVIFSTRLASSRLALIAHRRLTISCSSPPFTRYLRVRLRLLCYFLCFWPTVLSCTI